MELLSIITLGIFAETTYLTYKKIKPSRVSKDSILIDTSVLIDGRLLAIARSGLLSAKLVVPTSVVRELQFMADKADHDKRERARFGLDVIEQLQALDGVQLVVVNDGITDQNGVDEQLIRLAQKWHAKLCTIDYNLNKSARVQSVRVININELAHALRVSYLPGEKFDVKLIQPGQDNTQAVGYLDDGTMVVVDNAKRFIGQTLTVEATRVLQTAAGNMMFARHHEQQPATQQPARRPAQAQKPAQTPRGGDKVYHPEQQRRRPQKRSRTSPEDSLVALVNKTDD